MIFKFCFQIDAINSTEFQKPFIGEDVLHAGIATHFCDSSKIPDLENTLLNLKNTNDVENVISDFCPKPKSELTLAKHMDQINNHFTASSIEEIFDNLEHDDSKWAHQTINVFSNLNFLLNIMHRHFYYISSSQYIRYTDSEKAFANQFESDSSCA